MPVLPDHHNEWYKDRGQASCRILDESLSTLGHQVLPEHGLGGTVQVIAQLKTKLAFDGRPRVAATAGFNPAEFQNLSG